MNKISLLLIFICLFILSGCSSANKVDVQQQKELVIINAQQDKEIAVLEAETALNQEKKDQLDACFNQAELKRKNDQNWYFEWYLKDVCPDFKVIGASAETIKICMNKLSDSKKLALAPSIRGAKDTEEKDRAECLKIYPQN